MGLADALRDKTISRRKVEALRLDAALVESDDDRLRCYLAPEQGRNGKFYGQLSPLVVLLAEGHPYKT